MVSHSYVIGTSYSILSFTIVSDADEHDATKEKMSRLRKEMASYDADDAEEAKTSQDDDSDSSSSDEEDSNEDRKDDGEDDEDNDDAMDVDEEKARSSKARESRIVSRSSFITRYAFDQQDGAWCEVDLQFPADTPKLLMVDLVQKACYESVIREVPGIQRGFIVPNESENDKTRRITAEGINFRGIWERADIIDPNTIYSNDIAAILRTYGVEAARNAIIREIAGVFKVYGIGVDRRHLSLIADYMTFEGGYKPFNRMGIDTNVSPFLKMSYEMTCNFLTQATLYADHDALQSPASRIVVGRVAEGGTGSFELYQPLVTETTQA
jgi:DNA-directed RNA polymerase I subunit RPA1